jgi:NhaA family Na+:H+ antiporter
LLNKENTQDGRYLYPWEKAFARVLTPFEEFIQKQTTSGIMLMATAFVAIILANSPLYLAYERFIHTPISLGAGEWVLQKTLAHWVNEGLMTLFFLVVGLEIKREIIIGELSDIKKAALPMIAAVGGMLVPALIYRVIAPTPEIMKGWGIPMATDIAFCVSALVILGRRVPHPLMIFLVALAIIDDLGAVLVIALFYTGKLNFVSLGWSAIALLTLIFMNMGGIRRTTPYVVVGIFLWFFFLSSGIHATISGIIMAFCIPARPSCRPERFSKNVKDLLWKFDNLTLPGMSTLSNARQFSILRDIKDKVCQAEAPLRRLESVLHLPVALLVIPVFALTNAGIHLSGYLMSQATTHPVALGVFLGLVLGKFLGITVFSWAAVKLGVAALPLGMHLRHVAGVGLLGGIGFTMSIFIAELSFSGAPERLLIAKTSVILASLTSGLLGILWLLFCHYRDNQKAMTPYTYGHGV